MSTNNEKKRIGRRAIIGGSAILLIQGTLVYIVESFKADPELLGIGMGFFNAYTSIVLAIVGFIIGGLSATDIFKKK